MRKNKKPYKTLTIQIKWKETSLSLPHHISRTRPTMSYKVKSFFKIPTPYYGVTICNARNSVSRKRTCLKNITFQTVDLV